MLLKLVHHTQLAVLFFISLLCGCDVCARTQVHVYHVSASVRTRVRMYTEASRYRVSASVELLLLLLLYYLLLLLLGIYLFSSQVSLCNPGTHRDPPECRDLRHELPRLPISHFFFKPPFDGGRTRVRGLPAARRGRAGRGRAHSPCMLGRSCAVQPWSVWI